MEIKDNERLLISKNVYFEDKNLIKTNKELYTIGQRIFDCIENNIHCRSKDKIKYHNYLVFKLNNMAVADNLGLPLAYSRNKHSYIKMYCCQENRSFWELGVITTITDLLESNFYIRQYFGKFSLRKCERRMTVVELRPKLKDLIQKINCISVIRSENQQRIELRIKANIKSKNGKDICIKRPVAYKDTDHRRIPQMRRELSDIYHFYKNQDLAGFLPNHVSAEYPELLRDLHQYHRTGKIKLVKDPSGHHFTIIDRTIKRIFNDGTFLHGGRIYAFWQQIPRRLRRYLLINSSPVDELDYSGCQLRMLYNMMLKQDYSDHDPYDLPGISRDIAKKAAIITLNAESDRSAIGALMASANKDLDQEISYKEAERCIELFKKKHQPISEYFNSGAGIVLMRIESEVIVRTILAMIRKGICVLTIHDSCIFPIEYRSEVYNAMMNEYQSILKYLPSVK